MFFDRELTVAIEAAEAAGRLILEHYAKFEPIPDAPSDISTETDRAAQETILQIIHRAFPHDALCAEETTPTLAVAASSGPRLWIVDPIDGTRGFARKNGEFSVMVAFVENGTIVVGVVLEPLPWKCMWALKGAGCWHNIGPAREPRRCRVGAATDFSDATVTQSRSRTAKASPVVAILKPARVLETYSAGLKLAQVACGEADIYANVYPEFHDWDICAGHILVEEAGGKVTTFHGKTIHYGGAEFKQRGGMIASNGVLHERALETLKGIVA